VYKAKPILLSLMLCLALPVAAESLRDPTEPPRTATAGPAQPAAVASLTLDSIIISDNRRVAVINGESVREGDSLAGGRVLRIRPDRVDLMINQTTQTLRLDHRQSVRQSP